MCDHSILWVEGILLGQLISNWRAWWNKRTVGALKRRKHKVKRERLPIFSAEKSAERRQRSSAHWASAGDNPRMHLRLQVDIPAAKLRLVDRCSHSEQAFLP